ncbi:MAG: hypothetical protein ABJC39_07180 [Chloroflexota bacterium]
MTGLLGNGEGPCEVVESGSEVVDHISDDDPEFDARRLSGNSPNEVEFKHDEVWIGHRLRLMLAVAIVFGLLHATPYASSK